MLLPFSDMTYIYPGDIGKNLQKSLLDKVI